MKNNNGYTPAYPLTNEQIDHCERGGDYSGMTKREMFAMNAPEMPQWFERQWSQLNYDNKDYFNNFHDEFAPICPTTTSEILPAGSAALMKAWRFGYADLMLED
jgi:hypothetical protein